MIACNPVQEPDRWRLDTVGLAVPGVEVRIIDPERGEVVPAGEVGEIEVLSPSAMAGYLPESETAAAFRDRVMNGRKVAIEILDFFDRQGVTMRRADLRRINPHRADMFAD